MAFDGHRNFSVSAVAVAPTSATAGTSLTLATGGGALFPTAPFNVVVWPAFQQPLASNAEVVRVTAVAGDVLTIVRQQEGSASRAIVAGDQIAAAITAKTITDLEAAIAAYSPPGVFDGGHASTTLAGNPRFDFGRST